MKAVCILLCLVGAAVAAEICTMEFNPRCGADKKVYANKCLLKNANVEEADSFENCRGDHYICPGACPKIYRPVCGADGKLYPNKCTMQYENCGKLMMEMSLEDCQ